MSSKSGLKKYRFTPGSRTPKGIKAQEIGSEIDALRQKNGGKVTAADLVRAAANDPQSVLHRCFEWNDTQAANEYRLSQARRLLQSIQIVEGENRPPVRAYIVVTEDGDDSYEGTVDVMKDAGKREQVILRAYAELLSWRDRYSDLLEFASVFSVVDSFPAVPKIKRAA